MGGGVDLLEVVEGQRVADAGDDVLTLRVDEVVAVPAGLARGGIPREADAGSGGLAQVAEDHRADVHRRPRVVGDALAPPVDASAVGVPGLEDGSDGQVELFARILRERSPAAGLHHGLELLDQLTEVVSVQPEVVLDALGLLCRIEHPGELVALHAKDGLAEHLDQAPVRVPDEPLVSGCLDQALDREVVEADVEHRLHHAGHRVLGSGPHAHQERIDGVAESASDLVLESAQGHGDLHLQIVRQTIVLQVVPAGLGRDDEARGHRQAQPSHLRKVGTLAAQQVLLVLVALAEVVDELVHGEITAFRWPCGSRYD